MSMYPNRHSTPSTQSSSLDSLGVEHPVVDVRQSELLAAAAGGFDIAGERSLVISRQSRNRGGRLEPGLPDAGGELEDRVSLCGRSSFSIHARTGAVASSISGPAPLPGGPIAWRS